MQNRQGLAISKVENVLHTDDFGGPTRQVTDRLAVRVLIDVRAGCRTAWLPGANSSASNRSRTTKASTVPGLSQLPLGPPQRQHHAVCQAFSSTGAAGWRGLAAVGNCITTNTPDHMCKPSSTPCGRRGIANRFICRMAVELRKETRIVDL
jgi:hypothetical protein